MKWDMETVNQLIDRFEKSSLMELEFADDGGSISLKKGCALPPAMPPMPPYMPGEIKPPMPENAVQAAVKKEEAKNEEGTIIKAPLAGTFYRAPSPAEKPFVEEGTAVKKGQTIGLIEAMKIMSEIPSPCDGIVETIKLQDGAFAEFDAPLMVIREN